MPWMPPAFHRAVAALVVLLVLAAYAWPLALAALLLVCWLSGRRRDGGLWAYGTATLASSRLIAAAGLTAGTGIVLGRDEAGRLLRAPASACHSLVVSPTGGGKGVGSIGPTLMLYEGPVIVLDCKAAENYRLFSAYRRKRFGRRQVLIDPLGAAGPGAERSGFNPLGRLRRHSPTLADDARMQAVAVVRRQENEHQPFFNDAAIMILTAFILFVVCDGDHDHQNLASVIRLLTNPVTFQQSVAAMCASDACGGALAELGGAISHIKDKELSSVLGTLFTHVAAFQSEAVRASLLQTTFDLDGLRRGDTDLFLALPAHQIESHSGILRLTLTALLQDLVANPAGASVLVIADEVGHLGHIPALENAITLLRGFNVKLALYVQGLPQLAKIFPADRGQTALGNFDVIHLFNLNCMQTASWVSERIGMATVLVEGEQSGGGTSRSHTLFNQPQETVTYSGNDGRNLG